MSLPSAIFLDTSVLAGQNYNFSSSALKSFISIASEKKIPLILPDPTKREILRQIRDRSVAALRALEDARRRAPFLSKWKHFPKLPDRLGDWEVKRAAIEEWETFLKQFTVVELGYESVQIETVMGWYESVRAPFGEGKKRKEFPDAFAIAALSAYCKKNRKYLAVVSEDPDFKLACDHFQYLLHFPSLPALTELLLSADDAVKEIRGLVSANQELLDEPIAEEVNQLYFYHSDSKYSEVDWIDISSAYAEEIRIVGIGDNECTVRFDGVIEFSAKLKWKEQSMYDGELNYETGRVADHAFITGIAKLRIKKDRSGIEDVIMVELDQSEIEINREPR